MNSAMMMFPVGKKRVVCGLSELNGIKRCRTMAVKPRIQMDQNVKADCTKILKDLIDHSFSEPLVVKIPRDLKRVQQKLEGNIYSGAQEFADDVRQCFQNAKPYSPRWAAVLDAIFRRRWTDLLDNHQLIKPNLVNETSTTVVADHVETSPEKAARAAMLKTRFADTIFKASQMLQLPHKSAGDCPSRNQQPRKEQDDQLKMRRERERKALEEIEKTAGHVVDITPTMLKMLFGSYYPTSEPLRRLGLHMKNEEDD